MYSNEEYLLDILKETGLLTAEDIEAVEVELGGSTVEALLTAKTLDEDDVTKAIATNAGMEYLDLGEVLPSQEAMDAIEKETAARFRIIPVTLEDGTLKVGVADPLNFEVVDSLPHALAPLNVETVCASFTQVTNMIKEFYGVDLDAEEEAGADMNLDTGDGGEDDAPIIKLVTEILQEAFSAKASDIHIEPLEDVMRIRYRVDGALHEVASHPLRLHGPIMARLKIMTGSMSIDEKRVPQDGRIQAKLGRREIDLRVSTVPCSHGESVVMRILDKSSLLLGLAELGFFQDDVEMFDELIRLPDGIILVTGPTGSGKTTTLYACLNTINRPDRKIITVEDPVEYTLPGINQVHVNSEIGMTFARALRAILRQAPNICMIGEIRDMETASIAINASLTGHLVFSTLHTNDAPGAVARLTDIGIKPFLTASAVRAVIAQRLVRKVCPECVVPYELTKKEMVALDLDDAKVKDAKVVKGEGCGICRGTGYRGRLGIIETFRINDELRGMVNDNMTTNQLRKNARRLGMRTLREDGIRKMLAGVTTAPEVVRVTGADEN